MTKFRPRKVIYTSVPLTFSMKSLQIVPLLLLSLFLALSGCDSDALSGQAKISVIEFSSDKKVPEASIRIAGPQEGFLTTGADGTATTILKPGNYTFTATTKDNKYAKTVKQEIKTGNNEVTIKLEPKLALSGIRTGGYAADNATGIREETGQAQQAFEIIKMDSFTEPCVAFIETAQTSKETIYAGDEYFLQGAVSTSGKNCGGKKAVVGTNLPADDPENTDAQTKEITLSSGTTPFTLGPFRAQGNCGEISVVLDGDNLNAYSTFVEVGLDKLQKDCQKDGLNADGTCAAELEGACFGESYCERDFDDEVYDGQCEMSRDILAQMHSTLEETADPSPSPGPIATRAVKGLGEPVTAIFAGEPSITAAVQAMLEDMAAQEAELKRINAEMAALEKERARYLTGDKGVKLEGVKPAGFRQDPITYKNAPDVLKGGTYNQAALAKLIAANNKEIESAKKSIPGLKQYIVDNEGKGPAEPHTWPGKWGTEGKKFDVDVLKTMVPIMEADITLREGIQKSLNEADNALKYHIRESIEKPLAKLVDRKAAKLSQLQQLRQFAADNRPAFCRKFGLAETKGGWLVRGKFIAGKVFRAASAAALVASAKAIASDLTNKNLDTKTRVTLAGDKIADLTLIYTVTKLTGGAILVKAEQVERFSASSGKYRELLNNLAADPDAIPRGYIQNAKGDIIWTEDPKCNPSIQRLLNEAALEYIEWHLKNYPNQNLPPASR